MNSNYLFRFKTRNKFIRQALFSQEGKRLYNISTILLSNKNSSNSNHPTNNSIKTDVEQENENDNNSPYRFPLPWQSEKFYDLEDLDNEMRRQSEVCHGCRRCYNLCDSFPHLFSLLDDEKTSKTGDVDGLDSNPHFADVASKCTLCDLCFLTKCPYTPPHEFELDFPRLMLRYRAVGGDSLFNNQKIGSTKQKATGKLWQETEFPVEKVAENVDNTSVALRPKFWDRFLLANTDFYFHLASGFSGIVNFMIQSKQNPTIFRKLMEKSLNIHQEAYLAPFVKPKEQFLNTFDDTNINTETDAYLNDRKIVLFSTCTVNYQKPGIGHAAT